MKPFLRIIMSLLKKKNVDEMGILLGGEDPCDFNETTYTSYDSRINLFFQILHRIKLVFCSNFILTDSMYLTTMLSNDKYKWS